MAPSRQMETTVNQIAIVMGRQCAAILMQMHPHMPVITGQTSALFFMLKKFAQKWQA